MTGFGQLRSVETTDTASPHHCNSHLPSSAPHIYKQARSSPSNDQSSNGRRSEEHTSELQSLMRISYAVFCLTKKQLLAFASTGHLLYHLTDNKQSKSSKER